MTDTQKATPRPWPVWLAKHTDGYWLVTAGPKQFASIKVSEPERHFLRSDGTEVESIVSRALDEAFERQAEAQNAYDAMREALRQITDAYEHLQYGEAVETLRDVSKIARTALAAAEGKGE